MEKEKDYLECINGILQWCKSDPETMDKIIILKHIRRYVPEEESK